MVNRQGTAIGGRRTLSFHTLDEVMMDVDALVAAEKAGTLHRSGNWTLGQICGHLAGWIDFPYDGYPFSAGLPIKIFRLLIARPLKSKFLSKPMKPGAKIPGARGGTYATEVLPTEEGVTRLRKATERLKAGPPLEPNIIFGPLTHREWIELNLRHAELHLSFLRAE